MNMKQQQQQLHTLHHLKILLELQEMKTNIEYEENFELNSQQYEMICIFCIILCLNLIWFQRNKNVVF